MSTENLTYAQIAQRLKTSQEAARALVRRLRLPRTIGNDGRVQVAIDLSEIAHTPMALRTPPGADAVATLKAKIETLTAELAKLEAAAAGHRADYERERERDRTDRLTAGLLKSTAELMAAREINARIDGELAALRPQPLTWWRRLRSTGG